MCASPSASFASARLFRARPVTIAIAPTPSATSYGTSGNGTGNNTVSRGRPSLDTIAKKWPTPLASDSDGPKHPRSGDRRDDPRPNLPAKTRSWPTPVTTDAKDSARATTQTDVMHPGRSLTDRMRGHQDPTTPKDGSDTLVLVPEFVEALMGLPGGWTLVADAAASSILATAALPNREGSHSPSSPCDYEVGG